LKQKTRTCLIHSDNTIAELDNYVGHTFFGYREYIDPAPLQLEKKLYHMEFSSEPAQVISLTGEEINTLMECAIKFANGQSIDVYQEFHMMLTDRVFRNTYRRETQA